MQIHPYQHGFYQQVISGKAAKMILRKGRRKSNGEKEFTARIMGSDRHAHRCGGFISLDCNRVGYFMTQETKLYEVVYAAGAVHRVEGTICVLSEDMKSATIYMHNEVIGSYHNYTALTVIASKNNSDSDTFDKNEIARTALGNALEHSFQTGSVIDLLTELTQP